MKSTISIICPVRNMEGKLSNLESWVNKCNSDFQIILVCDSSTDMTLLELKKIKSMNVSADIKILEGTFGSPGSARNAGMTQADGDWVVFWDSDDIGNPRFLSQEVRRPKSESVDAIIFGYEIHSKENKIKAWTPWPSSPLKCINQISLNPGLWRFSFKRSSIQDLFFLDLRMGEDQLFINDFMRKSPQLHFSDEVTYKYFVNVDNQLTSNMRAVEELGRAIKVLSDQLKCGDDFQIFSVRILGKMLLTQMKKTKFPVKIRALFELLRLFFTYPKKTTHLIINSVWRTSK